MNSPILSAVVICFNEESNIARCLQSLSFCPEIVVVDAHSTDRTVEIARAFTPHVFSRPWHGYSDQKNYANSMAKGNWILSIDADEEVPVELRKEIEQVLAAGPLNDAYLIARRTIHLGRWIQHGGWYPNRLVRLFDKSKGEWAGNEVHERWQTTGTVGCLASDLLHYSFIDIADQVSRNNHYSSLGARRLQQEGRRFSFAKLLFKPISKFIETFLIKRGFLDHYPGFIISISAAYSVFLKWAKLWELEQSEKKN